MNTLDLLIRLARLHERQGQLDADVMSGSKRVTQGFFH